MHEFQKICGFHILKITVSYRNVIKGLSKVIRFAIHSTHLIITIHEETNGIQLGITYTQTQRKK